MFKMSYTAGSDLVPDHWEKTADPNPTKLCGSMENIWIRIRQKHCLKVSNRFPKNVIKNIYKRDKFRCRLQTVCVPV